MKKQLSLREQLQNALSRETCLRNELEEVKYQQKLNELKILVMRANERRFDLLLEGMCAGMKEGALPRRG